MIETILQQDPRGLFCKDVGFMLGIGFIWVDKDSNGRLGVFAVNPLGSSPRAAFSAGVFGPRSRHLFAPRNGCGARSSPRASRSFLFVIEA